MNYALRFRLHSTADVPGAAAPVTPPPATEPKPEGSGDVPVPAPTEPKPATGEPPAPTEPAPTEPKPATGEPPVKGNPGNGDGNPDPSVDEPPAPESTFKPEVPKDLEFLSEAAKDFEEFAAIKKLDAETAKELWTQEVEAVRESQNFLKMEIKKHVETIWPEEIKADPELGGDKLMSNLTTARKVFDNYATDGLRKLMAESGLGSHPEVVRFLYRLGKVTSEGTFVKGSTTNTAAPKPSIVDKFYGPGAS